MPAVDDAPPVATGAPGPPSPAGAGPPEPGGPRPGADTAAKSSIRDAAAWKLLAGIAMAASGEDDLEQILFTTLDRLAAHIPFTGGSIALIEGEALVIRAAIGPFADEALGLRLARGGSRSWRVVASREPFLSADLHADGLSVTTPRAGAQLRSWLAVPLVRRGEGIGLLEVDSTEAGAFDRDDMELLERVAAALSGPVELARRHEDELRTLQENRDLLERLEARERQQASVAAIGQAALAGAEIGAIFADASTSVARTLGVDMVAILERQRAGGSLALVATVGIPEGVVDSATARERPTRGRRLSPVERALTVGDPVVVTSAEGEPLDLILPVETAPAADALVVSAAYVPIGAESARTGVLCAMSRESRAFTGDDLNFLRSVANILASAIERHRAEMQEATARSLRNAFVGVISHELRTPITTIYGSSKLLQRPGRSMSEGTREQVLADIEAEADRLRRLVEDLLVLSRAEGGRLDIADEPLQIGHVVRRAAASEQARFPGWRFVIEIAADLPTSAGEETAVEQVVRNLVTNAAKYSHPGTTITVQSVAVDDEVVVRVLDEGVGVAPDEAERLFELFYRSAGTAQRASGAGIGLFVCRQLVEAMGGRIWARPRADRGSEFGFALPVQRVEDFG